MNFFDADVKREGKKLNVVFKDGQSVGLELSELRTIQDKYLDGNVHSLYLGIRGENMKVSSEGIKASLTIKEVLGNTTQLFLRLCEKDDDFIVSVQERNDLAPGDTVNIKLNAVVGRARRVAQRALPAGGKYLACEGGRQELHICCNLRAWGGDNPFVRNGDDGIFYGDVAQWRLRL